MEEKLSVINKTRAKIPPLPFLLLKNKILGKGYSLSVAFLNGQKIKTVNRKYRGKNKPTNILSFSLSEKSGEILLCPNLAGKEAKERKKTFKEWLAFLLIHGMLHLKGMQHGKKMEEKEKFYLSRTKF